MVPFLSTPLTQITAQYFGISLTLIDVTLFVQSNVFLYKHKTTSEIQNFDHFG